MCTSGGRTGAKRWMSWARDPETARAPGGYAQHDQASSPRCGSAFRPPTAAGRLAGQAACRFRCRARLLRNLASAEAGSPRRSLEAFHSRPPIGRIRMTEPSARRRRHGVMATMMLWFLEAYRLLLSAWIGQSCRFEPTCSRYTREAVETHGAAVGAYLGTRRLLRCHPWCKAGLDPVPSVDEWARRPGSGMLTRLIPPKR